MKRRLLLSMALALGTLSSFAYNVGDYVYTPSAKLKITGENLVQNGTFTAQTTGWVGQDGASQVSADNWSIAEGAGPNGENVLNSINGGDGLDNYAYQSISLTGGNTYVVSLQIKGGATVSTATTVGTANYVDAFANATGSVDKTGARQIFDAADNVIGTGWTTISDTIVANNDQYLVIGLGRLDAGTQVTGVEVHVASAVYDTRIAQAQIDYDKRILALPEFPDGKDELTGIVDQLQAAINGEPNELGIDIDDQSAMSDFMTQIKDLEAQYLNANSYDLIANNVINGAAAWSSNRLQNAGGQYGDWHLYGQGRWRRNSGSTILEDYFPSSYAITANNAQIEKTLPAGKYFFQIDAKGYTYQSGKANGDGHGSYTVIDYNTPVTNYLFLGNDSTAEDTLDARNFKTYYIIADVPAAKTATESNLIAGFRHSAQAKGGCFYYTNPVLRLISPTAEADITKFTQDNLKQVQVDAANARIDSLSKIADLAQYPWGKATLRSDFAAQQKIFEALLPVESTTMLTVKDADGNDLIDANGNTTQKSVADSILTVVRAMNNIFSSYYTANVSYTNLVAQVAKAQATFDDPDNANASASTKTALQNALTDANALLKTFLAQTDSLAGDSTKSADMIATLKATAESFTASTANYANPSEIQVINPFFATYRGSKNPRWEGWTTTGSQTDNGCWRGGSKNAAFENGTVAFQNRGNTTYSRNIVTQNITLTQAGAYEFVCQLVSYGQKSGNDGDLTTDHRVFYFAKEAASADSIQSISVHTRAAYVDTLGYGLTTPEYFVITLNKKDDVPTEYTFGFDALQNGPNGTYNTTPGANIYEFGGNHIRYYGDYNRYKADVLSTLQAEIAKAQATLNSSAGAADSVQYKALHNAILCAQSAIDGSAVYPISSTVKAPYMMTYVGWVDPNAEAAAKTRATTATSDDQKAALESKALLTLQRAEVNFEPVVTGINGVKDVNNAEAVKANAKGVYNIAGQKVAEKAENLPAGLYIVNGKKVLVK